MAQTTQTTATHQLSVSMQKPAIATEGEDTKYSYIVKNIGSTTFSGFIQMVVSWNGVNQNVYQPLNIQNLASKSETSIEYSQAPLASGYTWFSVGGAQATNGAPVEVFNKGGSKMFPFPQVGNQVMIQALDAMRVQSREENVRSHWTIGFFSLNNNYVNCRVQVFI